MTRASFRILSCAVLVSSLAVSSGAQPRNNLDLNDLLRRTLDNLRARQAELSRYSFDVKSSYQDELYGLMDSGIRYHPPVETARRAQLRNAEVRIAAEAYGMPKQEVDNLAQPIPDALKDDPDIKFLRNRWSYNSLHGWYFFYPVRLHQIELPLDQLSFDNFDFGRVRVVREKGRQLLRVHATPKKAAMTSANGRIDLTNFALTLWIDPEVSQIVRLKAQSLSSGTLSVADVAVASSEYWDQVQSVMQQHPEATTLMYDINTTVTMQWFQLQSGGWVPKKILISGDEFPVKLSFFPAAEKRQPEIWYIGKPGHIYPARIFCEQEFSNYRPSS